MKQKSDIHQESSQEIRVYKIYPVYNHPLSGHSFSQEETNKGQAGVGNVGTNNPQSDRRIRVYS